MSKFWQKLGLVGFWLTWPELWLALNNSKRARMLLVQNGKVLVVKSWLGDGRWSLPGGGIKSSESPAQAASREVEEELGIHVDPVTLKLLVSEVYLFHGIRVQTDSFLATTEETPTLRRRMEVNNAQWLSPETLNVNNASPDVVGALKAWGK